jgi:hypothetical protein
MNSRAQTESDPRIICGLEVDTQLETTEREHWQLGKYVNMTLACPKIMYLVRLEWGAHPHLSSVPHCHLTHQTLQPVRWLPVLDLYTIDVSCVRVLSADGLHTRQASRCHLAWTAACEKVAANLEAVT